MAKKPKYNWYIVTKTFRGGRYQFQIRVPNVGLSKDDWKEILDYLGEKTNGEHSPVYEYEMSTLKLERKASYLPVQQYPATLCCALEGYGTKVISVKYMI